MGGGWRAGERGASTLRSWLARLPSKKIRLTTCIYGTASQWSTCAATEALWSSRRLADLQLVRVEREQKVRGREGRRRCHKTGGVSLGRLEQARKWEAPSEKSVFWRAFLMVFCRINSAAPTGGVRFCSQRGEVRTLGAAQTLGTAHRSGTRRPPRGTRRRRRCRAGRRAGAAPP